MTAELITEREQFVYQTKPGSAIYRNEIPFVPDILTPVDENPGFRTLDELRRELAPIAQRFTQPEGSTVPDAPVSRMVIVEEAGEEITMPVVGHTEPGHLNPHYSANR